MALNHETAPENRKHTPKNFDDSALVGDVAWKNEISVHEYFPIGKLPDCKDIVSAMAAPPTTVSGDIYVLNDVTEGLGRQQIASLLWQSGTTVRATFDAGHDLGTPAVNDYIHIQNSDKPLMNGRFIITAEAAGTIDFTNASITSAANDEASSPSYASFGHANWGGAASGDWAKYDGTDWFPVTMGNGASVYNLTDDKLHFNQNSSIVLNIIGPALTQVVIDIGDWDMDVSDNVAVSHGLSSTEYKSIRNISALIRNDADTVYYDLGSAFKDTQIGTAGIQIKASDFFLERARASVFDAVDFDSTTYNRGWVTYWYTPDL